MYVCMYECMKLMKRNKHAQIYTQTASVCFLFLTSVTVLRYV